MRYVRVSTDDGPVVSVERDGVLEPLDPGSVPEPLGGPGLAAVRDLGGVDGGACSLRSRRGRWWRLG
jgi:hypothetical protein